MSLSFAAVQELTAQTASNVVAMAPAGNDIFSKMNTMASSATGTGKLVGSCLGVLFCLITAWKVRGAIAGIITGGIAAALFVWMVNNVGSSDISQPITDTIKGAPAIPAAPVTPASSSDTLRVIVPTVDTGQRV